MANIFISYRREDSSGHAGRLCDRLTARFGDARVFMDLQDIAPGQNFAQSIDETMSTCDCVIAVIGPRWLEVMERRATDEEDFLRRELAAALRRKVTVIPVLVGGARMPPAARLPQALSDLSHRNALELRDERFDDDIARLGDAVSALGIASAAPVTVGRSRTARWWISIAAAVGLLLALVAYRTLSTGSTSRAPLAGTLTTRAAVLDGEWTAEMRKSGQPPYRIRLTFVVTGDSITGMAHYPTGDGPVLDAHLAGSSLTFHTTHVPQFESVPATIRYQADVMDMEIRLAATDDSGVATGIARRQPRPSP